MRQRNWILGRLVTHQQWNDLDADIEAADRAMMKDLLFKGVLSGHVVAQQSVPDMTVQVSAGLSFSPLGERISTGGVASIRVDFDYLSASTAVADNTKSKILAIYICFAQVSSQPQTDANGDVSNFILDESYVLKVVQGAEAVSPTPPAPLASGVLLAYVALAYGATEIITANISQAPHQDLIVLTGTPFGTSGTGGRYGSYIAALQAIVTRYNDFLAGGGDTLSATGITYAGSGGTHWADGTGLGAATVASTFTSIVSVLGATGPGAGASGDYKIGVEQDTGGGSGTIAASNLNVRLKALRNASNMVYLGSLTWQDGTAVPSASMQVTVDGFITTLNANSSASLNGARKIGLSATGNFTAGSIYGGFQQLASVTAANDGAKKIGTEATGGLVGATVRAQLDELRAGGAFTGATSASDFTVTGGNWPKLNSRSVTIQHPFLLSTVVQDVGFPGPNPSAIIGPSDVTATIGGLSVATAAINSAPGHNAGEASYFVVEIPDPPNGNVLVSLTLSTKSTSGGGGTLPKYTLVTWTSGGALTPIGTVDVADTHSDPGSWTTTITDQVLTPTGATTIDTSTTHYGVLVKGPYAAGSPDSFSIYKVKGIYTVTSLRV